MSDEDKTGEKPGQSQDQGQTEDKNKKGGEPTGGDEETPKGKTYGEAYVKSLHEENARRRLHEKELSDKLKLIEDKELEAETDLKKKNDALATKNQKLEKELAEKSTAADRRYILSEARRAAKDAGIIDLDDIKALDLSDLHIDDNDEVPGLDELVENLKKSKPHWFKSEKGDSKGDKGGDKGNKQGDKDDKTPKKPIVTPGRKGGADTDKDWSSADPKELRKHLASYGVMS